MPARPRSPQRPALARLSGARRHAAPAIGYVSKGTIYFQVEGQAAQILKPGDAFYEPVGPRILHFNNASASEEAVFTDFSLEQAGEPFIVFPKPPTEAIDRRSFPTAPIAAAGVRRAVAVSERIDAGMPVLRREADPVVGYVAQGSVTLHRDGEPDATYAEGRSFYAPAGAVRYAAAPTGATIIRFSLQH